MLYQRHSFTVPASAGSPKECERVGHTQPDAKGKCYRCSAEIGGGSCSPIAGDGRSAETLRYVELLGGPLDGQIVRADQIDEHGTVTVDGVAYGRYPAGADEYKGMERREHAVDWQHRALLQNVPDSAIIEGAGIERAL